MKLSEAASAYYEHSGKASDVSRSLALAALGVAWIFRVGEGNQAKPDPVFLAPTLFAVVALGFDLLQYLTLTIAWGTWHRAQERAHPDRTKDPVVVAPRWLNWPGLAFFALKMLSVILAYMALTRVLWNRWVA